MKRNIYNKRDFAGGLLCLRWRRPAGCVQMEAACNRLRTDADRFYRREGMRDFHLKFSLDLTGTAGTKNAIGR